MFRVIAAALLLLGSTSQQVVAQDLGCSSAVSLNGPVIEVSSVSGEDTQNIQCALDVAARDGYREVLLVSDDYAVGEISVDRFVGDLKGRSADLTSVEVIDDAVSCAADNPGAVLEFSGGSPSVRNLALSAGQPCGSGNSVSLIKFTGESGNCARRTVFGAVDRIRISGLGAESSDVVTGVMADTDLACDFESQQINGSIAVNRVEFSSLDFGVFSALGNASAANITFNQFSEVGLPVSIVDARQDTNIFRNTFNYNDIPSYGSGSVLGGSAVFIASTAESPKSNSTSVKDNTFNDGGFNDGSIALLSGQSGTVISHSILISGNTFNGSDSNSTGAGIAVLDTSGGLVSGNLFKDGGAAWIEIASGDLGEPVAGWAIVSNDFSRTTASPDVELGPGTEGNVVGKTQAFPLVEEAVIGNNDVLESAATISVFSGSPIVQEARRKLEHHLRLIAIPPTKALDR